MGLLDGTNQATYYASNNSANYGNYQFVTLDNIINAFMVAYVGEGKIISKVNRTDVQFHAMRAIQELSYDVFRSFKSQEIEVPNTLTMILPQDYVNYVKIARVDSNGLERILYPTSKTSNPFAIAQGTDGSYTLDTARRKVFLIIPTGGANDITDGDRFNLMYLNNNGTTGGHVNFIFDKNESNTEGVVSGDMGPNFYIHLDTETRDEVSALVVTEINSFNHHTATYLGDGIIQIDYLDGTQGLTTPQGTGTEGAYAAGVGQGGVNGTNLAVTISESGTTSAETLLEQTTSNMWSNYQNQDPNSDPYVDDSADIEIDNRGRRYGLDPQHAQSNGTFFIDQLRGQIHFGSSLAGETILLKYVSDGLGTDAEMVVHKFCEEACYKWIAHGILGAKSNIPEYIVHRYKKERFAETRKAKIRLSNIKIEEFTQVIKGMGKQIK